MRNRRTQDQDVWEMLARKDPFWASCTCGKRRIDWQPEEFFGTGEQEVSWAVRVAQESSLYPTRSLLAVDFGCGPGRFIGTLKGMFQQVVGIDTSHTMLRLARRAHPEGNIRFAESTQTLDNDSVDLIYSTFVLQHLKPDGLDECFREFSRILHPTGLLIFQYPSRPRWTLAGAAFRLIPAALLHTMQQHILRYPGIMPMSWMAPETLSRRGEACGLVILKHLVGPKYSPNWKDEWYFAKQGQQV